MSEHDETLAEIVAGMRCGTIPKHRTNHELLALYADRIEAAHKRESKAIATGHVALPVVCITKSKANDMKAMREALVIAKKAICNRARANHICDSLAWENSTINANCGDILCAHRELCEAKTAIQKALAAPPRQCDMGTADEQYSRMFRKCHEWMCRDCKSSDKDFRKCALSWAQMPYEDGGEK